MANSILPQSITFGKVENNSHINSIAKHRAKSTSPVYRRMAEILSLSNEEAIEFLMENGFSQIIPGTHFAPIKDYALFFCVKPECLQSYLYRNALDVPTNAKEAMSTSLESFFRRAGLYSIGKVISSGYDPGVFDFYFEQTCSHYVTEWSHSTKFYSARVALSVIPLIANWRSSNNPAHPIINLNRRLADFIEAKRVAAEEAIKAAEKKAEAAKSVPEITGGSAEDLLYQLVKRAVAEILSGAKVEVSAPVKTIT